MKIVMGVDFRETPIVQLLYEVLPLLLPPHLVHTTQRLCCGFTLGYVATIGYETDLLSKYSIFVVHLLATDCIVTINVITLQCTWTTS